MTPQQEITPREALMRMGASTAEAVAQVLEMFAPGSVQRGEVTVLPDGASPFGNVVRGSIASSVSYVDGVTGANVFVLSVAGARGLASAMGAPPPEEASEGDEAAPLSELELSALAEAANQTMAAAAAAIGVVLGQEIEISTPDTRVLEDPANEAEDIYGSAPHAISTTFLVAGESCRLIQLVPAAFVVRMVRAMDEASAERAPDGAAGGSGAVAGSPAEDSGPHSLALHEALGGINLRVWAELGRARMPLGSALGLPVGAVLDLDRAADAPVDLYVNGMRFARGQLLVTEDGEWAVSLDAVESEGLRMLDLAHAGQPDEAPAELEAGEQSLTDVDSAAQPLGPQTDDPVETDSSSTDPETPETPDLQQPEVEGAVT